MESTSARFQLTKADGKKILKGLGIALAGTILTYLTDVLQVIDFGELNPIILIFMPVVMAAINAGMKWVKNNSR